MKTIAFKTFGCKANSVDTDSLYQDAVRRGFKVVAEDESADAYVINSCTVTQNADRDARSQVMRYRRKNPDALISVVGCYAQVAKEELLHMTQVDFVLGTAEKARIFDLFSQKWKGEQLARDQVAKPLGYLPEAFPGSRNARAPIKIQDGCNFSCSFCIIPEARGRSRSLPLETVLTQVDDAYAAGFNEIVLTGIHIAHYGWDLGTDLMTLLKAILTKPQGPRIRVSTLDPFEIPDELIELLASHPRLCPHLHIAIQSGSDKVLAGMRRIYKAREFEEVTQKIQEKAPNTFIGVDIIVGFPGEDESEFEATVKCLEKSFWTKLHVFSYSEREGTKAVGLEGKVPAKIIAARSEQLRLMSEVRHSQFLASQVGREFLVLLEKPHPKRPGVWTGHTDNYVPTLLRMEKAETKVLVLARGISVEGERLVTEVVRCQSPVPM